LFEFKNGAAKLGIVRPKLRGFVKLSYSTQLRLKDEDVNFAEF
jgi:hypothetical protein